MNEMQQAPDNDVRKNTSIAITMKCEMQFTKETN